MSSTRYLAELRPDSDLRRLVLATGGMAAMGGMLALALLPVAIMPKALVALAWGLWNAREIAHIAAGNKDCVRLQLDSAGDLRVYDTANCCRSATVERGTVVLQRFAWLRFRTADGRRHAELLRPKTAKTHDWRRFQVIWRHLGATA